MIPLMARLVDLRISRVVHCKLITKIRLSFRSRRLIPMTRESTRHQQSFTHSNNRLKSPMANMEEEHDPHHMLALLVLGQLRSPWTFGVYWHIRRSISDHTNQSFRLDLVSKYHVWCWNAGHCAIVPQVRPETCYAAYAAYLSCWIDRCESQ